MANFLSPARTPQRVGLREIAQAAGVSLMTVSLALHNSPKISAETRRRVRSAAEKLGYRPDPELARLMNRLRTSRVSQSGTVIALFDLRHDHAGPEHSYNLTLRRGIETQAHRLGFGLGDFRLRDYAMDVRRILRVVRQRGIPGAILLPAEKPLEFPRTVSWDGISVVSATTSVLHPRFHRVAPNQLHNFLALLDAMQSSGYQRIGLVISEHFDTRSAHYYTLVMAARGHAERILIVPLPTSAPENDARTEAWLDHHRPDLIVAQDPEPIARLLATRKQAPGDRRPKLVSLSTRTDDRFPYQDELPEYIGASAVDLLAGMMANHETGVPRHPRVTTIDGVFRAGRLTRRRPAP